MDKPHISAFIRATARHAEAHAARIAINVGDFYEKHSIDDRLIGAGAGAKIGALVGLKGGVIGLKIGAVTGAGLGFAFGQKGVRSFRNWRDSHRRDQTPSDPKPDTPKP